MRKHRITQVGEAGLDDNGKIRLMYWHMNTYGIPDPAPWFSTDGRLGGWTFDELSAIANGGAECDPGEQASYIGFEI